MLALLKITKNSDKQQRKKIVSREEKETDLKGKRVAGVNDDYKIKMRLETRR